MGKVLVGKMVVVVVAAVAEGTVAEAMVDY
jgi:hypothetical protein